uniref:C-type lectin domain-containing protein n=1 Tax=Hucho hucho TaxID=62062 RepID=A0A4W5LXV7_9TELE
MLRKSSSTGLLLTALFAVVSFCLNKQFHYVEEGGKTWEKAQRYCREKYIDLAFISNQEEKDEVNRISRRDNVWIGLYSAPSPPTEWKWSGGWNSSFRFWGENQPNNIFGNQDCVSLWKNEMNDDQCTAQYPILC